MKKGSLFKYFTRSNATQEEEEPNQSVKSTENIREGEEQSSNPIYLEKPSKFQRVDLSSLPAADPGLRRKLSEYHTNDQEEIGRHCVLKKPFQPRKHNFPQRVFGKVKRHFNPEWFDIYGNWLEYSIEKDVVYCLYCYMFKYDVTAKGGGDVFTIIGFSTWNKRDRLDVHMGDCKSIHHQARVMFDNFKRKEQSIEGLLNQKSEEEKSDYRIRLNAAVQCVRWLLRMGLAFRGHDESAGSRKRGNFLELLKFVAKNNEGISKVVLENAPKNVQLVSPDIQKDVVRACAKLTNKQIVEDFAEDVFGILVDESRDVSYKEQMAVVVRYVDSKGMVNERLLGIVHVTTTTALTLKGAIEVLLSEHGLTVSRIRGQDYDGANNMQGELNGLKTLILKENKSAFLVHCFAHQLQLILVAVASKQVDIAAFFTLVTRVVNIVGASCKRRDILRAIRADEVSNGLRSGEIESGKGQHQETSLQRPADTRWSSHFKTLTNIKVMFSSLVDTLEFIDEEGLEVEHGGEARIMKRMVESFEFVFPLHLMLNLLGITNDLCLALQRKDQDIINAMELVRITKHQLQEMRDKGWESLLDEVSLFCSANDISIPNMDDQFFVDGKSKRKTP